MLFLKPDWSLSTKSHPRVCAGREGGAVWLQCMAMLVLAACVPTWAQDLQKTDIHTARLGENFYLQQGYGGNTVLSTGPDGALVVDDEYQALTNKLTAAISKVTQAPVRYVVNTHWHDDHTGGNEAFGRAGALIIAQDNSARRMMTDQIMSLYGPQAAYAPAGQPKVSFSQSMRLRLNGNTIDLIHPGPAHTDGDAVVYFRERNVLMTGDLFVGFVFRPPFFDDRNGGSLEGMINASQTIVELANEKTTVIPGHGDPATRADVFEYRRRLIDIRDRIRQAIARGESEEEVVAAKPVGDFAVAGKGTDRWVRVVYHEYKASTP